MIYIIIIGVFSLAYIGGFICAYNIHIKFLQKHGYIRTKPPFAISLFDKNKIEYGLNNEEIDKNLFYPNYNKNNHDYKK